MSALASNAPAASSFLATLAGFGWSLTRSDLEDAFRALVGWPGEAEIPDSTAEQRRDLLDGVCKALVAMENDRIMPGDIFRLILDEAEDMGGGTYADGARAVLHCPRIFQNLNRGAKA